MDNEDKDGAGGKNAERRDCMIGETERNVRIVTSTALVFFIELMLTTYAFAQQRASRLTRPNSSKLTSVPFSQPIASAVTVMHKLQVYAWIHGTTCLRVAKAVLPLFPVNRIPAC